MPAKRALHSSRLPESGLALLLILLIGLSLWSWQALHRAEQAQTLARLGLEAGAIAERIESRFDQQVMALDQLAARWPYQHQQPPLWQQDAQMLLEAYASFQAIQWLDSNLRMRWIEPLAGNEAAVDFQYFPAHPGYPVLMTAKANRQPALSPLFELRQGGPGLTYYVPLYRVADDPSSFDGFLIGVFRPRTLLTELTSSIRNRHVVLEVSSAGQHLFSHQPDAASSPLPPIELPLRLANRSDFLLAARASDSLVVASQTRLPELVLLGGGLISLLLTCSLYLLLVSRRRTLALRMSNRQLQGEIARRLEIEKSLQASQGKLQLIIDMTDHSHDALFLIGLRPTEVIYMNRSCWHSLGYTEQELRELFMIAPQDVMPDFQNWVSSWKRLLASQQSSVSQQQVVTRSGERIPLEISTRPLNRHGRHYLICVGRNNREQLEIAEQLRRQSEQDGLTGLFNRRHFDQTLNSEWRRHRRQQQPLGLLMLDVDHFKAFNDQLGHQAGDDALRQLAGSLEHNLLREGDCACRYGGEEFAVILPGADRLQCAQVAEHLQRVVERLQIAHPGSPLQRLTISIGAASLVPMAELSPSDLVQLADKALYQAKSEGRNRTCYAEQVQH